MSLVKRSNILRDTIHNASRDVVTSTNNNPSWAALNHNKLFGRGVMVGVVGAIMALTDLDFQETINLIVSEANQSLVDASYKSLSYKVHYECLPQSWLEEWRKAIGVVPV